MKTKMKWHKTPARGCKNPLAELYRYTVVRLSDNKEIFVDRKPRLDLSRIKYMVWDNRENEEVQP